MSKFEDNLDKVNEANKRLKSATSKVKSISQNVKGARDDIKSIAKGTIKKSTKSTSKTSKKSSASSGSKNTSSSTSKKATNGKIRFSVARLVVFLIITAITITFGLVFKPQIEDAINKISYENSPASSTAVLDKNGLSVHFIDIGQGDSIAIRFPDNKTMLVDAGPKNSSEKLIKYLKNEFFEQGENKFDYLLLTHSDEDHCGGMQSVCDEFVIDKIYRPNIYCVKFDIDETVNVSGKTYTCETYVYYYTIKSFKNEVSSLGKKAEMVFTDMDELNTVGSNDRIETELYSIDFYAPTQDYVSKHGESISNDYSPIMVLNYNGKKIMLTGDASEVSERLAMEKSTLPDVDILKVGHHGSATSSSQEFLEEIKPEIAVICVGENNKYGHPTTAALDRLEYVGATVYRTDQNGNVVANVTSDSSAAINMYFVKSAESFYIHVEYLMAGIILLSLTFCFGIKVKS